MVFGVRVRADGCVMVKREILLELFKIMVVNLALQRRNKWRRYFADFAKIDPLEKRVLLYLLISSQINQQ